VQIEAALDTAWHVAPDDEQRERIDVWRDEVRTELENNIEHLGDSE